jgi:hypothetical protein
MNQSRYSAVPYSRQPSEQQPSPPHQQLPHGQQAVLHGLQQQGGEQQLPKISVLSRFSKQQPQPSHESQQQSGGQQSHGEAQLDTLPTCGDGATVSTLSSLGRCSSSCLSLAFSTPAGPGGMGCAQSRLCPRTIKPGSVGRTKLAGRTIGSDVVRWGSEDGLLDGTTGKPREASGAAFDAWFTAWPPAGARSPDHAPAGAVARVVAGRH